MFFRPKFSIVYKLGPFWDTVSAAEPGAGADLSAGLLEAATKVLESRSSQWAPAGLLLRNINEVAIILKPYYLPYIHINGHLN